MSDHPQLVYFRDFGGDESLHIQVVTGKRQVSVPLSDRVVWGLVQDGLKYLARKNARLVEG